MKFYVAILLMIVGLALAEHEHIHDDGQPGCKTDLEIQVKYYRNLWDPTSYWVCEVKGQPASAAQCAGGTGWLDSQKQCVLWKDWDWEIPVNPPSKP